MDFLRKAKKALFVDKKQVNLDDEDWLEQATKMANPKGNPAI
jgi:hypothetical protein